jgi:acid phosphatase (class A)
MIRGKPERSAFLAILVVTGLALGSVLYQYEGEPEYLHASRADFVALFPSPPPDNSPMTRAELDVLLVVQRGRSAKDVEAARADRKTEVWQFARALGLDPAQVRAMPALDALAEQVEDDIRPYVRAAKHNFTRLRPYELDSRLEPCIENVRSDLSYPSGHATFGFVMAYLLADMVPERRSELIARAREFAHQRAVCGVHFPSDLDAGNKGAVWLARQFLASEAYRKAAAPARDELRTAMRLPAL